MPTSRARSAGQEREWARRRGVTWSERGGEGMARRARDDLWRRIACAAIATVGIGTILGALIVWRFLQEPLAVTSPPSEPTTAVPIATPKPTPRRTAPTPTYRNTRRQCSWCKGTGRVEIRETHYEYSRTPCHNCAERQSRYYCGQPGYEICFSCSGTGFWDTGRCWHCNGAGMLRCNNCSGKGQEGPYPVTRVIGRRRCRSCGGVGYK